MTEQGSDIIGIREVLLASNEQEFLDKLRVLEGQIGSYETCINWLNRELGVQEDWFCYQTLQSAMQDAQQGGGRLPRF